MQKKHIIVTVIVIVLWCAFMGYRHTKRKRDTQVHTKRTHDQVTEAARKSPRAGLAQVGMALKKYYEKNHAYPPTLAELYPEYLANKSLIDAIDWYYEPRGADFLLSKTAIVRGKKIVASLDKSLRLQTTTSVMVAAPDTTAKEAKKKAVAPRVPPKPAPETKMVLAREEFLETLRQGQMHVTSVSLPKADEARVISTVEPKIVSVVEPEVASGVESELGHRYLVWKDKTGVLGFGNVQYPNADRLSIYAVGRWYNVEIPSPNNQEPVGRQEKGSEGKKDTALMCSILNERHLVWKDKHGTLGFSNIQYPQIGEISVLQAHGWTNVEMPAVAPANDIEENRGLGKTKGPERIASTLSAQYLVWKDKNGTLGFGNVQYPDTSRLSIHQSDSWVALKRRAVAAETHVEEDDPGQKVKPPETMVSELSARYLVWKDKYGTLGFGNVQYPESASASHIHINGTWERNID